MTKKYFSRLGGVSSIVLIVVILILSSITIIDFINNGVTTQKLWIHLVDILFILILLWVLLGSYCYIDNEFIKYANGPMKGRIRIDKIVKISSGKNTFGMEPGLATNGIYIETKAGIKFFFSPKNQSEFINKVVAFNKSIKTIID